MKVRFKTEYQRSYRSRSVSPPRPAALAGLRSDHMGISREPCFQRRKKLNSHHPPRSCGSPLTDLDETVSDAQQSKTQASPPPAEPEHPPGPQPRGQQSGNTMDTEKPKTSEQVKSQQHIDPLESSTKNALFSCHDTVPPFKEHPVSMDTEYQRSFKGLDPPTTPRLRKKLEHERTPLFHTHVRKNKTIPKNKSHLKSESPSAEVMSPDRVLPHSKTHRVLTEYESKFRCPLRPIPEEIEATTGYTSQIKELRERALSYRRRAWGTNFSRDHLSQLLSEHNALWEPTETIDSTAEGPQSVRLDLAEGSSAGAGSGRGSLEALDLASNSSRTSHRASAVDLKDEEIKTSKTNITPQRTHSLVVEDILPTQEEGTTNGEEEGRLPTPALKMMPMQRTHLDLTTPATGGAILVGKLKGTDEVIQRSSTSHSAASVHIPVRVREAWTADTTQHKATSKPVTPRNTPPLAAALPPTVPLHCIQGTLRNANFQHNGDLGLRFSERNCASDEDDRLSVMSWRSAASHTMASKVLERAQKRRENFWGKS